MVNELDIISPLTLVLTRAKTTKQMQLRIQLERDPQSTHMFCLLEEPINTVGEFVHAAQTQGLVSGASHGPIICNAIH